MSDPLFSVEDQVVLVSGASRGIGKAIARGFAARSARVVITGRDPAALQQTAQELEISAGDTKPTVVPLPCDVANERQTDELTEQVLSRFGRIDTLINCAGVNRRKPAEQFTEEDYDFVMDVNLKGAFRLSQKIGKAMIRQRSGCQINISSLNNDRPLKNVVPYAMSKSAMGQMTRALAMEWGPHGIRVNALAPGFILTDLTRRLWSDETMEEWGRSNTPLGRLGQSEDLIGTALFLASPAAAFLTGQILYVDGGFTAGWAWPIPE